MFEAGNLIIIYTLFIASGLSYLRTTHRTQRMKGCSGALAKEPSIYSADEFPRRLATHTMGCVEDLQEPSPPSSKKALPSRAVGTLESYSQNFTQTSSWRKVRKEMDGFDGRVPSAETYDIHDIVGFIEKAKLLATLESSAVAEPEKMRICRTLEDKSYGIRVQAARLMDDWMRDI